MAILHAGVQWVVRSNGPTSNFVIEGKLTSSYYLHRRNSLSLILTQLPWHNY